MCFACLWERFTQAKEREARDRAKKKKKKKIRRGREDESSSRVIV